MPRLLRFCLLALASTALFGGCCANTICDCNDSRADALYFRFQIGADSLTGSSFGRSEVDTVYLLRYPLPLTATGTHDSIALLPTTTRQPGDTILLNNNAPFALATGRKLGSFEYRVMVYDYRRQLHRYLISNIVLKGDFGGTGCCTCYTNTGKTLEVNGQPYNATETDKQPLIIPLTK
jgi:hypothetical protein